MGARREIPAWSPGGRSGLGAPPRGVKSESESVNRCTTGLVWGQCLLGAPWVIHRGPGAHRSPPTSQHGVSGGQSKLRWGLHPSLPLCAQDVPATPRTGRPALSAPAVMQGRPLCPSCTHCTSELDSGHWAPTADMGPQSRAYGERVLSLVRLGVSSACLRLPQHTCRCPLTTSAPKGCPAPVAPEALRSEVRGQPEEAPTTALEARTLTPGRRDG